MARDEDDREMRTKSNDNERYEGNKKTPGKLHSKEANTRMAGGKAGKDGSGAMGDDEVTLAGYDPAIPDDDAVSKQDDAESDVDDLAAQLTDGVDDDVARRYARMILRRGDVLTASKAAKADLSGLPDDTDAIVDDMADDILRADDEADARQLAESIVGLVGEVGDLVDNVRGIVDGTGDEARMNDRMESAD